MKEDIKKTIVNILNPHYRVKNYIEREALKIEEERKEEIKDSINQIEFFCREYYNRRIESSERDDAYQFHCDRILDNLPDVDVFALSASISSTREDLPKDRDLKVVTLTELKEALEE